MSDIQQYQELVDGLVDDYRSRTRLDRGQGEFHLRSLVKIAEWAYAQQPVQPGDRIRIDHKIFDRAVTGPSNGWWPYRHELKDGVHLVREIMFNAARNTFAVLIEVDDKAFQLPISWIAEDDNDDDELITTREALDVLGWKYPSRVQRAVDLGTLKPAQKFPGRTGGYLFHRADVDRLAARMTARKDLK